MFPRPNLAPLNPYIDRGIPGQADANQYYYEQRGALDAQRQIVPEAIAAEAQMLPGLQQYQSQLYGSQSQNLMGIYGGMQNQTVAAQSQYGGQLLGMYGQMGQGATNQAINSLGNIGSGIYNTFGNQALSDLSMGSSLNSQETTQAQQSARAAAQSRGLNFSRQGMDMEVLNTYSMGQNRQYQRRQAATQAYGMAQGQQTYGGQAYLNPAMQQSSVYSMPGLLQATQGSFQQMGPQFLQPESQYLANIRANRIQQENADTAASAQKTAGAWAAVGSVAGALIKCWVAREVYGSDNAKWVFFRDWLESDAPSWLDELYEQEGERFAKFISDKPLLKNIVRKAMDLVVG
jgi:hypothetical protein